MNSMNDYYDQQYPSVDTQRPMDGYTQDENMDGMDTAGMESSIMGQSQTLDQIINHNNQETMRRRRTFQPQYQQSNHPSDHARRSSMLEFGSMNNNIADFRFDPNPAQRPMPGGVNNVADQKNLDPRKVRSREDLSLDTSHNRQNVHYDNQPQTSSYSPAMMSSGAGAMDPSSSSMFNNLDMSADFDNMNTDSGPMNISVGRGQTPMFTTSPIAQNFPMSYSSSNNDAGGGETSSPRNPNQLSKMSRHVQTLPQKLAYQQQQYSRGNSMSSPLGMTQASLASSMPSPAQMQKSQSRRTSQEGQSPFVNGNGNDMNADQFNQGHMPLPQASFGKYQNVYSSSGFDMLGVLTRVATRRNPEINIGPVDLSCAFVVCDIQKHDLPIVYCSEMFERLTGYTRYEILGRNCRFLQAPDGKVQPGLKRRYVDDKSVLYLKNQINRRAEAQLSLINYRKGGQPFMNLLTMIPICWDTEELRFFVGFQVDLVEQPNSVSGKNPDGTYAINYNRSALPAYVLPAPDVGSSLQSDIGQTISRDEVSQVLGTIGNGETDLSKRIWDKVLLENTDDVVHVLSLKGLFLYLSPASRKVLEYDASELVGTALSSVCHPSDIVPVTRELKDSSNGTSVNVVYRIRRKHSGYTWFEAHGCLHTEQGKGKKCIILVGRERPVYALERQDVSKDGGIGDSELWTKMSTTGMFLYISSNSRSMLDRLPEDLVGTSVQSLMRPESRKELGRALELARAGEKATFRHDLQNKRGQVLQAQTTIYPGDARKGFKPTYLLAQTRLLKMTRAMLLQQKSVTGSVAPSPARTDLSSLGSATPAANLPGQMAKAGPVKSSGSLSSSAPSQMTEPGFITLAGGSALPLGNQDEALASEDNIFDELKTTRSSSWQFELRQMERQNRVLSEELQALLSRKKKRKRRKGQGLLEKDCVNCHTKVTPEWRRGPSGNRDLCNSCGLRWAKQNGRVSPRKGSGQSDKSSISPAHVSSSNNTANNANAATGVQSRPRSGDQEDARGTNISSIDEGQEPAHASVLPT